jgi:hypothetical protein
MPLLALPSEIHLQILAMLDFTAFSFLRATNMYFYRLPSKDQITAAMASYECEESLPDYYSTHVCTCCRKVLSRRSRFASLAPSGIRNTRNGFASNAD